MAKAPGQAPTTASPKQETLRAVIDGQFEQLNAISVHVAALEVAVGCERPTEVDAGETTEPTTLPCLADLVRRRLINFENRLRDVADALG